MKSKNQLFIFKSVRYSRFLVCVLLFCTFFSCQKKSEILENFKSHDEAMKWWKEARFGMMIHWGVSSQLGGEWNGKVLPQGAYSEWIMNTYNIPVKEYEKIAATFNPIDFDADKWVSYAKNAGMKYIIFTAKHHDGFALYKSKSDPYNIYDFTSFKRDALAELAEACKKQGIRLGLYYSHDLDWHEFNGGGTDPQNPKSPGESWGNNWDFPDYSKKDFSIFFEKKVIPQVTELLQNYGPIFQFWFDTPITLSKEQAQQLKSLVNSIQPNCLISHRIGHNFGDFVTLGDNLIPMEKKDFNFDGIGTTNDSWGYSKFDHEWKSAWSLVDILSKIVEKNGNYELNIGPDDLGRFNDESVRILDSIGIWMKANGESIYGTSPNPFPYSFPWGSITQKANKLYLHIHQKDMKELEINGIKGHVKRAFLLKDSNIVFDVKQQVVNTVENLKVDFKEHLKGEFIPTIVLEFDSPDIKVNQNNLEQDGASVLLQAGLANIHKSTEIKGQKSIEIEFNIGCFQNWFDKNTWIDWQFQILTPGEYEIEVITSEMNYNAPWKGGHQISMQVNGQSLKAEIKEDVKITSASTRNYKQALTKCGKVNFAKSGNYKLELKPLEIKNNDNVGLSLLTVRLVKISGQ
jgi:alpha-L-fucosidase